MDDSELKYNKEENDDSAIETWRNSEGDLFRMNGPATIQSYSNGYRYEFWYQIPKKVHRENEPAVLEYINDVLITQTWYTDGVIYNPTGGPSRIQFFYEIRNKDYKDYNFELFSLIGIRNTNIIRGKIWSNNIGFAHRDDNLPALINYDENGKVIKNQWCINGRLIREENYE